MGGTGRNDSIDRQVALVTGCSSGFGLLIALELAASGFRVIATMRNPDKHHELKTQSLLRGVQNHIDVRQLDVTEDGGAERVVNEVLEQYGRIDVLVNNAGYAAGGFTEEIDAAEWRAQMETNVIGLIRVTRAVLPHMREHRRGRIIQMSSISGQIGIPGMAPYNASKFAVEGFSEALRLEMLPWGVHVSVIEPGSYKTDIWHKGLDLFDARKREQSPYAEREASLKARVEATSRNAGDPLEVARLVARIALTSRPRFRYPIGRGVRTALLLKRWLPWRLWEKLIRRASGS